MNPALDSRARFEAHRLDKTGKLPLLWSKVFEGQKEDLPAHLIGVYLSGEDQAAWEAWQAARASSAAAQWISVDERLPEDRGHPRQVVAIAKNAYPKESCYPGEGIRRVQQDWVIRQWPHNFSHWMEMAPAPPAKPADTGEVSNG